VIEERSTKKVKYNENGVNGLRGVDFKIQHDSMAIDVVRIENTVRVLGM
jgi:hypothetical protein